MKTNNMSETIGIDLGNTIVEKLEGGRQAFPDALRIIARLVSERFGKNSYIVSKVTPEQKIRAQKWLSESGFHLLTGIPENNVEFCAERHEKAGICRMLGITHFIDDRPSVLVHMHDVPHRFLFQGNPADTEELRPHLGNIIEVNSWIEIESYLLPK